MSHEQESQLETLYNFLKTQGYRPTAYNSSGKKSLAKDAVIIEFDFIKDDVNYGKTRLSIDGSNTLTVYIDDNVTKSPNAESKDGSLSWTQLLKYLRDFSFGKLTFDVKNADDWEYDMAKRKDSEKLDEGYHSINKNTSYSDNVPNVKIRIQHSKNLGEGEQRYRNVARIFIENANGERFMLETKKPGIARVYARHVAEGGRPYDEKWNHINSLVEDYTKMAGFVRATKNGQFNESTQTLVNEGVNHYMGLRETLHKLSGKKGYSNYFESWSPTLNEDIEGADLSEMFVSSSLDPRIESAMPILAKLSRNVTEMAEVTALDEWATSVIEEDLTPTGKGQIEKIVELLSEPISVGPDAVNVLTVLSDLNLEDSDLENALRDLAYENSDADAVPVIKDWMSSTSDHRLHAIVKQLDSEPQEVAEARDGDTNFGSTVTRGSWVVYDGSKVKRFKTRDGAKAYAEKNGGKVASSEFYADNIQKQGVTEGPKEVLKLFKFAKGGGILGGQLGNLLGEEDVVEGEQRMSRAAKGHEKYGKEGMQALAKAGRDGASEKQLDAIRNKYDKYNEAVTEGEYADDEYYDQDDQSQELYSGCYVRDEQDPSGEIFQMRGDPTERRVQITDRNGSGWNISPERLTPVAEGDPDIARYFGGKDIDEGSSQQFGLSEQMEEEMPNLSPEMQQAKQQQQIMMSDTPPQDDNLNMLKAWAEYSPHRRIDYYVIAKFGNKGPNRNIVSNSVQKTLDVISNFPDMSGQQLYDQFDLDQRDADRLYVAYENVADEFMGKDLSEEQQDILESDDPLIAIRRLSGYNK